MAKRKDTFRPIKVTLKLMLEITCVAAWVIFAAGISINDPPLRSIAFTFGLLVVVTTVVRAMTRSIAR